MKTMYLDLFQILASQRDGSLSVRENRSASDGRVDERGAAGYLGVSPAALRHWRAIGEGPGYLKLPGRVWYWQEGLEHWLWSQKVIALGIPGLREKVPK